MECSKCVKVFIDSELKEDAKNHEQGQLLGILYVRFTLELTNRARRGMVILTYYQGGGYDNE